MKTIFIFPILILFFGVSEHQGAVLEDCDEDNVVSSSLSKSFKNQAIHQTQRKNNIILNKQPQQVNYIESRHLTQRSQQPGPHHRRQQMQFVRRSNLLQQRKRIPPLIRPLNQRQQISMMWPPKPNPMNVIIKPIKKSLESPTNRKYTEYFPAYPYKKQKRIKVIPAYDEYENYPETEYVHEVVYPPEPRRFNYVEMENPSTYNVPCDPDDSEYKDLSTEIYDNENINARDMSGSVTDAPERDYEIESTEKSYEPEVQTEKEMEVTTPSTEITTPRIETRNGNISINNNPESIANFMEMLMRGILALTSCMKTKSPLLEDLISNILNSAINSCKENSS